MKLKIIIVLLILAATATVVASYPIPEKVTSENKAVVLKKAAIVFEEIPSEEIIVLKEASLEEIIPEEVIQEIMVFKEQSENKQELKEEKPFPEKTSELNIIDRIINWGHHAPSSPRSIDTIIIHSCYDALGIEPYSVDGMLEVFKLYGVAPHYLISRDGTVYRFVADENIAYHAGVSEMPDGRTNINDFSLGIELMNLKSTIFTEEQYDSLIDLVNFLKEHHEIEYVLGHDQIAPDRKTDPWNFDWQKFNEIMQNG